jgi:hypothetical protein
MFAQLIISPRQQADSIKIPRRGLTDVRPPAPLRRPHCDNATFAVDDVLSRAASSCRTLLSALLLLLLAARLAIIYLRPGEQMRRGGHFC